MGRKKKYHSKAEKDEAHRQASKRWRENVRKERDELRRIKRVIGNRE